MVFMKTRMDEVRTTARSTVNSSGPIRAARENWLNGIVENSLVELSASKYEQLKVYGERMTVLQNTYNELLVLSNKRVSDLHSLYDFMQV